MSKKQSIESPGLLEKTGCQVLEAAVTKDSKPTGGRERVIYFSFLIQSPLRELFTNPKEDKRILKIEITCHCLFRLSGEFTSVPQFQLVEAYLDDRFGNFEGCVHMLEAVFKGVGCSFILYRTINMSVHPNGSCDYSYHCNNIDRNFYQDARPSDHRDGANEVEEASSSCLQRALLAKTGAPEQFDSNFSSFSVTNSTVSRLFKELERDIPKGWSGDASVAPSRKSLEDFLGMELAVQQLEVITSSNYEFVIEEMFFEALIGEMRSEMLHCVLYQIRVDLVEAVVLESVNGSCLVSQSASQLVTSLLEPAVLVDQTCADCLGDNCTVVYSSAALSAQGCANNNSTCCDFEYDSDDNGIEPVQEEGDSIADVSESLIDERWSESGRQLAKPPTVRRFAPAAGKQQSTMTPALRLEQIFYDWCDLTVQEACLETFVELVSQRLVVAMYKTSRSKSQFECRVVKTFARFGRAFSELSSAATEPGLADVITGFFACVADTLNDPDARDCLGQTSDLVMAVRASAAKEEDEESVSRVDDGSSVCRGGWQWLRIAQRAFQQAIRDQLSRLGPKLQRKGRHRRSNNSSGGGGGGGGGGSSFGRRLAELFDHSSSGDASSTTVTTGDSFLQQSTPAEREEQEAPTKRPQGLSCKLRLCVEAPAANSQEPEDATPLLSLTDLCVDSNLVDTENCRDLLCAAAVSAVVPDGGAITGAWMTAAISQCQTYSERTELLSCLATEPLRDGHASWMSVEPIVADAAVAVVFKAGPIHFACASFASAASCTAALSVALPDLATNLLAEFRPAPLVARAVSPRACVHRARSTWLAASHYCLQLLDAKSQLPVLSQSLPTQFVISKCENSTGLAACNIHGGVRPSSSHCYPLGLPEAAETSSKPSDASCGWGTARVELEHASIVRQSVLEVPAIAEQALRHRIGAESTRAAGNQLRAVVRSEPAWKQFRKARCTQRWPNSFERATISADDCPAPGGGGDWPERTVREWSWARPATARLNRPTRASATELPVGVQSVSTSSSPPISLVESLADPTMVPRDHSAIESCIVAGSDCSVSDCNIAFCLAADWSLEKRQLELVSSKSSSISQPQTVQFCCRFSTEDSVDTDCLIATPVGDALSCAASAQVTIFQRSMNLPEEQLLSAGSGSLLRLAVRRSQSYNCISTY
ncbi:hypothetical protein BOX15_Mlig032593g2 [Macrostomum lignano]|uniref:Uncharacterized protein n=1 Tax=Macrostomum lignano TaxID=282301 RepID=A0A267GU24_9PLAT|nr:hypothetical protein BOX15_Mlig032593g2 [Macrostomum lignano]